MCFHYCQKMEQKILILRASRSAPELLCEPSYERLKGPKTCQKNTCFLLPLSFAARERCCRRFFFEMLEVYHLLSVFFNNSFFLIKSHSC